MFLWRKTNMKSETKKVAALGTAAVVLAAGLGAGIGYLVADDGSAQIESLLQEVADQEARIAELASVEPVVVQNNVTVVEQVEVEKIVEVKVDNGNLQLVLDTIVDNDGDVSYLTDGLFDDEVDQIVERIILTNDMKAQAQNVVNSEFLRELERQHSSFDKRDVSRVKIDLDTVTIGDVDFKYKDATVTMDVEFRYESTKYVAQVEIEIYNNKARPIIVSAPVVQ
jgi:hypothetical protein